MAELEVDDYLDEVAISRALAGDASVWPHLTPLEREEAVLRVRARRLAEQAENEEWARLRRKVIPGIQGPSGFLPYDHETPRWLVDVATAAGYREAASLLEAARRIEKRRRAA